LRASSSVAHKLLFPEPRHRNAATGGTEVGADTACHVIVRSLHVVVRGVVLQELAYVSEVGIGGEFPDVDVGANFPGVGADFPSVGANCPGVRIDFLGVNRYRSPSVGVDFPDVNVWPHVIVWDVMLQGLVSVSGGMESGKEEGEEAQ
jgi:hypothetical protein